MWLGREASKYSNVDAVSEQTQRASAKSENPRRRHRMCAVGEPKVDMARVTCQKKLDRLDKAPLVTITPPEPGQKAEANRLVSSAHRAHADKGNQDNFTHTSRPRASLTSSRRAWIMFAISSPLSLRPPSRALSILIQPRWELRISAVGSRHPLPHPHSLLLTSLLAHVSSSTSAQDTAPVHDSPCSL